jgi:hypothetical protein
MFRSCCWHDVWYGFWWLGKTYPNTSWEDAPVPPSRPIPICDHGEKAHVKQSRYLTTTARAYYCCPYMIVNINFLSLQLDKFDFHHFFVNVIERRIHFAEWRPVQFLPVDWRPCGTHKFLRSYMIQVNLLHITVSSVEFHRHWIHLQWQMRRSKKQLLIMSTTHLCANVGTILSWWTHLPDWITHHFGDFLFLYWLMAHKRCLSVVVMIALILCTWNWLIMCFVG